MTEPARELIALFNQMAAVLAQVGAAARRLEELDELLLEDPPCATLTTMH